MSGAPVLDRRNFRAGTRIFAEGSRGGCAYLVQSGRVEISTERDGETRILGSVGPGGIFGEMALIDGQPRMATATAVEGTVCVIIGEETFRGKIEKADPFIRRLLALLVAEARSGPDSPRMPTPRAGRSADGSGT